MPKARNIIIFITIAAILVLTYVFFIRTDSSEEANLVSTQNSSTDVPVVIGSPSDGSLSADDFLPLLLSVKNIKLEDGIFAEPAFKNLKDSSITLVPDGSEGRPNPFAPLGQDISPMPPASLPAIPNVVPEPESDQGAESGAGTPDSTQSETEPGA